MKITPVTSSENPQYKQLKKLSSSARERRKQNKAILDGVHLLQALAETGNQPELIVVREDSLEIDEIQQCLHHFPEPSVITIPKELFNALSPVETPVGILGLITIPAFHNDECQFAILLENIQDPGNLGSIIRTATAAGVDTIFLTKGCAEAWSPKALRAGMGAQFTVAIHQDADLNQAASIFDEIIATELHADKTLYDCDLSGKLAFVFGNEGAGLSSELLQLATKRVTIPMPGKVESLNVAAATAICLFEAVRQRSKK